MDPTKIFSKSYLYQPVDNSPLIVFRLIYGFLITAESWGAILTGWVNETFVEPDFTFNFIGFGFLQFLVGPQMYAVYIFMGLFGVCIMLGWYYKLATTGFFVLWTITYLLQKSHYNNHYYLLVLLSAIMIILPANRFLSIDVKRKPSIESLTCPQWIYVFFILQLWIVYTYGSFSKIYTDWLEAVPIRLWFGMKAHYWLIGEWLQAEWLHPFIAYGGILYDGLVVPALLWRRTRWLAVAASVFFHLFNSVVFQIGIFPYLSLAFTIFFFPPEQVRAFFLKRKPKLSTRDINPNQYLVKDNIPIVLMYAYFILQLLLPLRYHLYPGNVHWTEEGHRMAWKMMLRSKSGFIRFKVVNKETAETKMINPRDYITPNQYRRIGILPDMVWQFVQVLKKDMAEQGWDSIEIYATSSCSLNGHPAQALIKPDYDLSEAEWHIFKSSDWINPYDETFRGNRQ
jgi:hypothetical protein